MVQPRRFVPLPRRSLASGLRAALLIGAALTVLRWSAGWPAPNWRVAVAGSGAGDAGFDRLLVSWASLIAWLGLSWFCLVAALALASGAPGMFGRLCGAIARRLTPRILRRLVEAAIGISLVAGPLAAGSAFAVPAASAPPAASAAPAPSASAVVSGRSIWLDRPTSSAASPPGALVPIELDRPTTAFVATTPRPISVLTPAGPATLIAGSPHRAVDDHSADDSYVVRRGDALWDIAARHLGPSATAVDVAREWPRWYEANRAVIGDNPSLIRPGERLVPPR